MPISPSFPPFPGVFPDGGTAEGWKDSPSPGWQRHTVCKHPCRLSPAPASPSRFRQPSCNLRAASLAGKGPQASSKSSHQVVFLLGVAHTSRTKHGKQPGRQRPRTRKGDAGGSRGSPSSRGEHSSSPGADCFSVSNPNPNQHFSPRPPRCKTQHKQYVHPLFFKEKIIFWVMPLPPSLKPGKDGEGSRLSPGLSTLLGSLLCIITCNLYATLLEKH